MSSTFKEVIVIDLEATCWATPEETARNTSEVIEIGVCLLDMTSGEIKNPQGLIIKPILSKISPLCENLTSITQDMVDVGMRFEKAIKTLKLEYGVGRRIMAAYGNYDQHMLMAECDRHQVNSPFGPTYLNIAAMCALKLKATRRLSVKDALKGFGLQFEGWPHRGVDDAIQAARLLWEIVK